MAIKCKRISMSTVDELDNWLENNNFVPVKNIKGINDFCNCVYVRTDGSVATKALFRGKKPCITYWLPADLQTGDHWGYVVMRIRCVDINNYKYNVVVRLHKLIIQTFNPNNNPELTDIDHIDGNKLNNALDNLEYVTHAENIDRYWNKTRIKRGMLIECCGQYPKVYMAVPVTDNMYIRYHKCSVCGKTIKSNNI